MSHRIFVYIVHMIRSIRRAALRPSSSDWTRTAYKAGLTSIYQTHCCNHCNIAINKKCILNRWGFSSSSPWDLWLLSSFMRSSTGYLSTTSTSPWKFMLCPPTLPRSQEYGFQLYIPLLYHKCPQVIKLRTLRKNKALAAETVVSEDIFKNLHQQKRKHFDHSDPHDQWYFHHDQQDSTQVRA